MKQFGQTTIPIQFSEKGIMGKVLRDSLSWMLSAIGFGVGGLLCVLLMKEDYCAGGPIRTYTMFLIPILGVLGHFLARPLVKLIYWKLNKEMHFYSPAQES